MFPLLDFILRPLETTKTRLKRSWGICLRTPFGLSRRIHLLSNHRSHLIEDDLTPWSQHSTFLSYFPLDKSIDGSRLFGTTPSLPTFSTPPAATISMTCRFGCAWVKSARSSPSRMQVGCVPGAVSQPLRSLLPTGAASGQRRYPTSEPAELLGGWHTKSL